MHGARLAQGNGRAARRTRLFRSRDHGDNRPSKRTGGICLYAGRTTPDFGGLGNGEIAGRFVPPDDSKWDNGAEKIIISTQKKYIGRRGGTGYIAVYQQSSN